MSHRADCDYHTASEALTEAYRHLSDALPEMNLALEMLNDANPESAESSLVASVSEMTEVARSLLSVVLVYVERERRQMRKPLTLRRLLEGMRR